MNKNASTDADPSETATHDDKIVGVALRWSLIFILSVGVVVGLVVLWFQWPRDNSTIPTEITDGPEVREATKAILPESKFTDITESAGIEFKHENGAVGDKYLPESMGGGCAFFDYDGDGDPDILFVNSKRWSWDVQPDDQQPVSTLALYQNDGAGNFTDVTKLAGLAIECYGMGCATGDYDNDGDVDVFISTLNEDLLFRNDGGQFTDVTAEAGVAGAADAWGSSCGWVDYDRDGDLDLVVCHYVKWSKELDEAQNAQLTGVGAAYDRPENYAGQFPYLYNNNGDGKFTEVGEQAGLHIKAAETDSPLYKSLGLTFEDFDNDGWLDIFIANDTVQNLLFRNKGDGSFEEIGALAGVAFDRSGNARGAMGIDAAAFRNNKAVGVVIGNFANEMTALYVTRDRQMQFDDEAMSTGLGPTTRLSLTFGVLFLDYDLDGRLDIFAANGHLEQEINRVQASQHYAQPPQLFWNCGSASDSEFAMVPDEKSGKDLSRPIVGRGASYADIDGDGDLDLLITSVGGKPRLLRNDRQPGANWLRFKLRGKTSNTNAIGARVILIAGDQTFERRVNTTRSYLSQVELTVTFGLGKINEIDEATVIWPDGESQSIEISKINQVIEIEQP